jgi:hypothetical protein
VVAESHGGDCGGENREHGGSVGVHSRRRKPPWPHQGALRGDTGERRTWGGGHRRRTVTVTSPHVVSCTGAWVTGVSRLSSRCS